MGNLSYACEVHGHIFGPFMPQDRTHVRRCCVIPGCPVVDVKQATS